MLLVVGVYLSLTVLVLAEQVPLSNSGYQGPVLSPDIRSKISELVKSHGITGYSLGVFGAGRDEYAQWGNRTEDGDLIGEDVRLNSELSWYKSSYETLCRLS
jgi:hypothetical protein